MPDHITKHVRPMTYRPKIHAVRSGECRQTIQKGNKVSEGDEIVWHGWAELPNRSKWDWMLRVTVSEAIPIMVDYHAGLGVDGTQVLDYVWYIWDSKYANDLAVKDFIDPPHGLGLRDVLTGLNGKMVHEAYQIIRW